MKAVGIVIATGALGALLIAGHARTGAGAQVAAVLPGDFQSQVFSKPASAAHLNRGQVIDLINKTYWNVSQASRVDTEYLGWTPVIGRHPDSSW
ncbi:MAG: hypothetical protein M3Z66_22015, partial [Chloroflexota bacterium]|nr:hypothetical protein [Chloroflexota bacterium]